MGGIAPNNQETFEKLQSKHPKQITDLQEIKKKNGVPCQHEPFLWVLKVWKKPCKILNH